ncbi:MAG: class I SAM-dependent methyltransferase [Acidobacteriota bacterium]|nr:class I SAM-dependent methyltransferase [Acidobacteriota bacterium]MDH3530987.1 class I SAM-dependent methyltransferase [Acidobacteriota bacterium]
MDTESKSTGESGDSCPLCGGSGSTVFVVNGCRISDCGVCGHRFHWVADPVSHLSTVYDESYFTGGGAGYPNYLAEAELLRARGAMYARKIVPYVGQPGKMLDIGAAAGCILSGFIDEGWEGIGLEPNGGMIAAARDLYGLELIEGTLESFETDQRFDLVSAIQVAGHFYDPRMAFENAFEILKTDGVLLIETWNRESLLARLFGENWHEYSPPSVVQWWSPESLCRFLAQLGFDRIAGGRTVKKISGMHLRSLLDYKFGKRRLAGLIPERFAIPYPSEDLFWGLYRKRDEGPADRCLPKKTSE